MYDHVVIIGAGPVGPCLALALARRGMAVDVLERQPAEALAEPAFDGREIALTHAPMRVLQELGVWQYLPAGEIAPVRGAPIADDAGPGFAIDGSALGRAQTGVRVSNHLIRVTAQRAVGDTPDMRVHAGCPVAAVSTGAEAARAILAGGRSFEGALPVAVDSRFSETRRMLDMHMHDFGLSTLLCRVQQATAHDDFVWEWFGHGQTRALLPLGEHLSSVVLTVSGAEAPMLQELPSDAFAAEIAARYEGRLGAVQLASTRHAHPLVATSRVTR